MHPVTVLLAAAIAVVALPHSIDHTKSNETIDSNPGTGYNNTWETSNGSTVSNEAYTSHINRVNVKVATVGLDYGRCGSGFGGCQTGSCCSDYGLVSHSSSF
jgi:hypothetical protein